MNTVRFNYLLQFNATNTGGNPVLTQEESEDGWFFCAWNCGRLCYNEWKEKRICKCAVQELRPLMEAKMRIYCEGGSYDREVISKPITHHGLPFISLPHKSKQGKAEEYIPTQRKMLVSHNTINSMIPVWKFNKEIDAI